jgi:hypothetical protein
MNIQTRSETKGLEYFATLEQAFEHSQRNPDVWKISISIPSSNENFRLHIRLVRTEDGWLYESIDGNRYTYNRRQS